MYMKYQYLLQKRTNFAGMKLLKTNFVLRCGGITCDQMCIFSTFGMFLNIQSENV